MAVQRNPIAGTSNPNDNNLNCLQRNGFRISTSSREQIAAGLNWWAGETGGNQVIIYSTKDSQPEAYPLGNGDYTPVAWGSFNELNEVYVLELINGLPGRPANTQYTTLADAVTWLQSENKYFMMNQDYPFIFMKDAAVLWDPSVPQCSGFGVWDNQTKTQNLGNPNYINLTKTPSLFAPADPTRQQFSANGGTAYGTFQATQNHPDSVFVGDVSIDLNGIYSGEGGWMATMWFRHAATAPYKIPLFCIGDPSSGGDGMVAWFDQSNFHVGNSNNFKSENYTFSTNTWYMVNVVYDHGGLEWRVFVNGQALLDGGTNGYNWSSPQPIEIAGNRNYAGIPNADVTLQMGFFMIDTKDSESRIGYNYAAFRGATSINPKY
jgi:hypothetical protein